MPLTTAEKTEIANRSVTPTLWTPGRIQPPAGVRVMREVGKRVLVSGKAGLRLGTPPVCLIGGEVVGTHDMNAGWEAYKRNGWSDDHITWSTGDGEVWIYGVYAFNAADTFAPPKGPTTKTQYPKLRTNVFHCHTDFNTDDWLEDDGRLGATVEDCLIERTWVFISDRPGAGNWASPTTYSVHRALIHVSCLPDTRMRADGCQPGWSSYQIRKQGTPRSILHMENCVIKIDSEPGAGDGDLFTLGSTFRNCVLIWARPKKYPGALPSSGLMITDDLSLWDRCKGLWLERHDLQRKDMGDGSPLPPPPPPPTGEPTVFQRVVLNPTNKTAVRKVTVPPKPADAAWCHIGVDADDPDGPNEAEMILMPGTSTARKIILFGESVIGAGFNNKRATVKFTLPADEVKAGQQDVNFAHVGTGGCIIYGVTFEWAAKADPDGPNDNPDTGSPPTTGETVEELREKIKVMEQAMRYLRTEIDKLQSELHVANAQADDLNRRMAGIRQLAGTS